MNETIKDFVKENLILPDIQREFVWDSERICKLFDSILRGYPIGTMLIWKLKGENINKKNIRFYNFLQNYNEFNSENNNRLLNFEPNTTYYAILDGQQRTQSLIIGLNGFMKLRKYRGKYDDPESYKKNFLYINLLGITKLDSSGVEDRITVETVPLKHYEIEREILKAVKLELEQNNITIPYPQLVIHNE